MKNWIRQTSAALVLTALSTLVTRLISGESLSGVVQLKNSLFAKYTIPAWTFTLLLFLTFFLGYHALENWRKQSFKAKLHFVPDAHNCGWSIQSGPRLEIRAGGNITLEGTTPLTILKAFVKGTKPVGDFVGNVRAHDGSGRMVTIRSLDLSPGIPVEALLYLNLSPLQLDKGRPFRTRLIFRDKYNRDFRLNAVEFPYVGPPE